MADIADIRQALSDALSVIPSVQVSPYNPTNPTMPILFVLGHGDIEYGGNNTTGVGGFGGMGRIDTQWNLVIRGYVSTNLDLTSQQRLDRWLSSNGVYSVKAAVESDPTLGGLADWTIVRRANGSTLFKISNTLSIFGTDFNVTVQTSY